MRANYGALAYSNAAGAYSQVGVESGVMSATPHQLIVMLFDGLDVALRTARLHMQEGNISAKGAVISKAIDIVNQGLMVAVDRKQGGEIAENLVALYSYITNLLLESNFHNDLEKLDEAAGLLAEIGSAWREIG